MKGETHRVLYLSSKDVADVKLEMEEIIRIVEEMFRQKASDLVEMPPKLGIHPAEDSFIHAMPASVNGMSVAGIKWVSAYPHNPELGLPQITGQIVLNDPRYGLTIAIVDCTWITAARTAAASALAARYLARNDSEIIGILGCGVQGRSHLEAFMCEFSVRQVFAFDVATDTRNVFVKQMKEAHGIEVSAVTHPREAVEPCDIVITAGPITDPPHAIIREDWVQEGTCGVSIDYASYWHPNTLAQMDQLCTDDVGQYQAHLANGYLKGCPPIDLELSALVAGLEPGRKDSMQRTFARNLGLVLEDVVVAHAVVEQAKARGIGTWLPR